MAYIPIYKQTKTYTDIAHSPACQANKNDCAVIAVTIAAHCTYARANRLMTKYGRKAHSGTPNSITRKVMAELGYNLTLVEPSLFISRYPGRAKNLQHVTSHHMDRFRSVWEDGRTYMMVVGSGSGRSHILTIIDGVNHDHTRGHAKRAMMIFLVTKKK